jgi:hypothetical protein
MSSEVETFLMMNSFISSQREAVRLLAAIEKTAIPAQMRFTNVEG